ncbi:MAG TPA: c-type cytochrome [Candidatus Sulfotelmatobacter sp.]|jgi:cytochrome c2|nr:c-type cytochrome [Candidatus Sulfotelmatobacter sp.]
MKSGLMATICGLQVLLLTACTGGRMPSPYSVATGGDAREGRKVIESYGCGACHTIPGIHAANGVVGPPLYFFSRRTMIAGELPNTPDNLIHWIENPPAVEAGTAMPKLGLSNKQARDAAAYLYTLR